MKRVGIFMDIVSLYTSLKKRYKRKLRYDKAVEFLKDIGDIEYQFAYGIKYGDEANAFIKMLQSTGFVVKYKGPHRIFTEERVRLVPVSWAVGITVDIMDKLDDLDIIILGSNDLAFKHLIEYLREKGKVVVIFATNVSRELRDIANKTIEIPESLLEDELSEVSESKK